MGKYSKQQYKQYRIYNNIAPIHNAGDVCFMQY